MNVFGKHCNTFFLVLAAFTAIIGWIGLTNNGSFRVEDDPMDRKLFFPDPATVMMKLKQGRKAPEDIKYAAFGASVTWGSGIVGDRNKLSYPKLLSPNASNLAIRATGPNYPSACTQTMVGDENFDVIILEFFPRAHKGLHPLTRRLRARFPDAIIIILREWSPMDIINQNKQNLRAWARKKGLPLSLHHPKLHMAFLESEEEWFWTTHYNQRIRVQERAAKDFGAYILPMTKPEDPRDWLFFEQYFAPDFLHKSNEGHEEVAKRVRHLVDMVGVPAEPRIGTWDANDSCLTWFETGDKTGLRMSPSWRMNMFSNNGGPKYALEITSRNFKIAEGSLTVTNPSQDRMTVYVSYMITSPAPSKYPRTQVTTINKEGRKTIELSQDQINDWGINSYIHVHQLQELCMIPPGDTVLHFKPMERTEHPFRLVSVAITGEQFDNVAGQPIERVAK